jgi:signal peptidase I
MADGASGEAKERLPAEPPRKEEGKPAREAEPVLKEWCELLLKAGFCALVLYQFVFQVFIVRQGSMAPNYHEGEWVLVDKVTYRFREPRTGDVVVFELVVPDHGRRVYRDFIKRVIAGPGDRVAMYGDVPYVNGRRLDEPYLGRGKVEERSLADEYYLPPGYYFVLGDHRGDSRDSRYDAYRGTLGLVPAERIKGVVRW